MLSPHATTAARPIRINAVPQAFETTLCNEFYREDGVLAVRVVSRGGWLDLRARKLIAPPPALAAAILALARSEDYTAL